MRHGLLKEDTNDFRKVELRLTLILAGLSLVLTVRPAAADGLPTTADGWAGLLYIETFAQRSWTFELLANGATIKSDGQANITWAAAPDQRLTVSAGLSHSWASTAAGSYTAGARTTVEDDTPNTIASEHTHNFTVNAH